MLSGRRGENQAVGHCKDDRDAKLDCWIAEALDNAPKSGYTLFKTEWSQIFAH